MSPHDLRHQLRDGNPCRGLWLTLPCPPAVRLLARLPYHWFCIDAEHGPMGAETMTAMVAAVADAGRSAVVRIAHSGVENVQRALDAGAAGVIGPMIETPEQAGALVAAAKYPPMGARSLGSHWAGLPFELEMMSYARLANTRTLCLAQIESAAGLERVHEIASTRGLDGLFVGPFDLMLSLGLEPGEQAQAALTKALDEVARVAKVFGLPAGVYCPDPYTATVRIKQGYSMVSVASDVALLLTGAREAWEAQP
jgi:4-hydroxy-2-oxoheptanedioate aldolase